MEIRYNKKCDVFICHKDCQVQFSNMDMMTHRRQIKDYVVFRMCFGWKSLNNPLYKLMTQT